MKPVLHLLALAVLMGGLSSCATPPPQPEPKAGLYKEYDEKVNELREAVDRGELTIAEAEIMRKEAFAEYMKQVEEKQVKMEYRNY